MMHLPLPNEPAKPVGRKMRWWYEALADFMLANPSARQNDIAAHFRRGVSTISIILNSDSFKAYYRQRRAEFQDSLSDSVKQKLMSVADVSLDMMLEKLEKKRDSIPLEVLQKTSESALKALGYGATAPGSAVQVNVTTAPTVAPAISLADLEAARVAFRNSQAAALPPPSPAPTASPEEEVVDAQFTDLA